MLEAEMEDVRDQDATSRMPHAVSPRYSHKVEIPAPCLGS